MKMPIAEVADRYTILLTKVQQGIEPVEILNDYAVELDNVDYKTLHSININMWMLEDEITKELGRSDKDYYKIGALYQQLRKLTIARMEAKNKIAAQHGGPIERKNY